MSVSLRPVAEVIPVAVQHRPTGDRTADVDELIGLEYRREDPRLPLGDGAIEMHLLD